MLYTHLGYFGASGGAGASVIRFLTRPRSLTFQIRQAVPAGLARARFCSWAHLWVVLVRETMYLWLITLIKTYSTCYMAIGGGEGMDGAGWLWMTCSINRTPPQLGAWGVSFAAGLTARLISHGSLCANNYILVVLMYLNILHPVPCIWGGGNGWIIDKSQLGSIWLRVAQLIIPATPSPPRIVVTVVLVIDGLYMLLMGRT